MLRSVTVDADFRSAVLRRTVIRVFRRRLVVPVMAGFPAFALAAPVSGSLLVGAAVGVMVAAGIVYRAWSVLARSVDVGFGLGDVISTGYAGKAHWTVRDARGQLWLARGGAIAVVRDGPLTAVHGRDLAFALPTELVSDDDVAFLEGAQDAVPDVEPPAPVRAAEAPVTIAVQRAFLRHWTVRAIPTLEVSTFLWAGAWAAASGLLLLAPDPRDPTAQAVAAVLGGLGVLSAMLAWVPLRIDRKAVRRLLPVGLVLSGAVTDQGLTLAGRHAIVHTPWTAYRSVDVGPEVVELRRRDELRQGVQHVPTSMFSPEELRRVVAAVSTRTG